MTRASLREYAAVQRERYRGAPELLDRLTLFGELALPPAVDKQLRQLSRPTLARLLAPARAQYPPRRATMPLCRRRPHPRAA